MARPLLHLDADSSIRALHAALTARGYDVTRTPNVWMPLDAMDVEQLLRSTAQGRILFTFNIPEFQVLARRYQAHAGIILAAQRRWTLSGLIAALACVLSETTAEAWNGQVRGLNQWRV